MIASPPGSCERKPLDFARGPELVERASGAEVPRARKGTADISDSQTKSWGQPRKTRTTRKRTASALSATTNRIGCRPRMSRISRMGAPNYQPGSDLRRPQSAKDLRRRTDLCPRMHHPSQGLRMAGTNGHESARRFGIWRLGFGISHCYSLRGR